MTSRPLPFLLAVSLVDPSPRPDLARWTDHALAAERAGVDLLAIEAGDADAVLVGAALAPRTTRIGIVPVASPTVTEPFHVSTAIATVDYAGRGRAGWLAEVLPAGEAQGRVTWTVPADVHADAAEHIEAVRALWDSWEDGAEIRDAATARFVDRARLHHTNLRGEHLAVRGPSITPRPPQGHPPVFVRVAGADDLALAWVAADVVVHAGADALPVADLADGVSGAATDVDLDAVGAKGDARVRVQLRELSDGSGLADGPGLADGSGLADRIEAARADGFDGVLVRTSDLPAVLGTLAPLLAAREAQPATVTLRERLGLPAATNRFARASA